MTPPDPVPRFKAIGRRLTGAFRVFKASIPRGTAMSENTTKVSDATFEADVLRSSRPVLVDFWAEWCGPCKMIGPSLEELAKEYGEKVTIAKVNIDESPSVASRYNVRSIPALMVFKGGQVAASRIGAMPKNKIKEWVDSVI